MAVLKIREDDYLEAFMITLGCSRDDFKIKPFNKGKSGPMIAEYKDMTYLVNSLEDLYDYAELCLTDVYAAMLMDPGAISDIMESAHTSDQFFTNLLKADNELDKADLALLLGIHNTTGEDFWYVFYNHANDPTLYGKAIVAAAETFDLESLKRELVEIFQQRGDEILCMFVDGLFSEVVLNENSKNEKYFLIHDVDYIFE